MKSLFLFFIVSVINLELIAQSDTADLFIEGKIVIFYKQHVIIPPPSKIEIIPLGVSQTTDSLGNFKFEHLDTGSYDLVIHGQPSLITLENIHLDSVSLEDFVVKINALDDWVSKEIAAVDIEIKKPKLLLAGGISPIVYYDQHKFERKYHIEYYDYGDVITVPFELMKEYNKRIFEYLDFKYGTKWRQKVRPDVIGLQDE